MEARLFSRLARSIVAASFLAVVSLAASAVEVDVARPVAVVPAYSPYSALNATRIAFAMPGSDVGSVGDESASINVDGTERTYVMHFPNGSKRQPDLPVVLVFHGGGMNAQSMARLTHFDSVSDQRGFLVVYPNGIDGHWNDGRSTIKNPQNDIHFVASLIDVLHRQYHVDPQRVYATGISNGALFAERIGCDLSLRVSAIAAVAGTLPTDIASTCRPLKPIAVLQIDGTKDPIMPFDGGRVSDLGGAGEGGQVLSVASTMEHWASADHCSEGTTTSALPPRASFDPTRILVTRTLRCPLPAKVSLLTVVGGGHTWPGGPQYARPRIVGLASRQLDASEVIANFFLALPAR